MWVRTENNGAAGAEAGRRAGPGGSCGSVRGEHSAAAAPGRRGGRQSVRPTVSSSHLRSGGHRTKHGRATPTPPTGDRPSQDPQWTDA